MHQCILNTQDNINYTLYRQKDSDRQTPSTYWIAGPDISVHALIIMSINVVYKFMSCLCVHEQTLTQRISNRCFELYAIG